MRREEALDDQRVDDRAAPAATCPSARATSSRSWSRSLRRYPRPSAPCEKSEVAYTGSACWSSTITASRGCARAELFGGAQPLVGVRRRHPDVGDDDVGLQAVVTAVAELVEVGADGDHLTPAIPSRTRTIPSRARKPSSATITRSTPASPVERDEPPGPPSRRRAARRSPARRRRRRSGRACWSARHGRRAEATSKPGSVVVDDELGCARRGARARYGSARRPGVLDRVLHGLERREVDGWPRPRERCGRGRSRRPRRSHRSRGRSTAGRRRRPARRASAGRGRARACGAPAQPARRGAPPRPPAPPSTVAGRRRRPPQLRQPDAEQEQPLLRAVVQVPLEPESRGVAAGDDPSARRAEVVDEAVCSPTAASRPPSARGRRRRCPRAAGRARRQRSGRRSRPSSPRGHESPRRRRVEAVGVDVARARLHSSGRAGAYQVAERVHEELLDLSASPDATRSRAGARGRRSSTRRRVARGPRRRRWRTGFRARPRPSAHA